MMTRLAVLALLVPVLAGCQSAPPAMSVEEAKKVTTTFSGAAFVPPPRTINDITAILDQQKVDEAARGERLARLDASPPDTRDPEALSRFYFERGVARRQLGRTDAVPDLEHALQHARAARTRPHRILANLAWASEAAGQLGPALEYLRQAVREVPTNDRGWLFGLHATQVWFLTRMGDLPAADTALRDLVNLEGESRRWTGIQPRWRASWNAAVATSRAALAEARGELGRAEAAYREAAGHLDGDPDLARTFDTDLAHARLGRVLARQGRLLEAEKESRTGLLGALRRTGRYSVDTASLMSYLAGILSQQGRPREQEALIRAGLEIHEKLGSRPDSLLLAFARRYLADALQAQGRHEEALAELEAIRQGLAGQPDVIDKHWGGDIGWAATYIYTGRPDAALPILKVARERIERRVGPRHFAMAMARGATGIALRRQGDTEGALEELAAAVRILDEPTGEQAATDEESGPTAPTRLHRAILVDYITLLADVRGTPLEARAGVDAAAEAFRIADIARGQAIQQSLGAAAARATARDAALADLVRREQDARKQLTALQGALANLLSQPTDQQDQPAVAGLRQEVEALRGARRALAAQIAKDFPSYAQLVSPPPATLATVRGALRPGEAVIATFVTGERTFVWAVPHSGPVAFTGSRIGHRALDEQVSALRRALDPSARTVGDIPAFDLATAHAIYRTVLEPVRPGWEQADTLLVVAHGPLAHLPFALLPTRPATLQPEAGPVFANYRTVPWLVRSHAVTVLPSVASLVTLRAFPAGDPGRRPFVGFGDPYFSPQQARRAVREAPPVDVALLGTRGMPVALRSSPRTEGLDSSQLAMLPRLPETADEIRSIALAMNADLTRDVFVGERANEEAVRTVDLAGYRVIAFATHGLVPGELDGLTQPALALTAPEVAGVEGDGLLTMEKILGLRLDADWVVLSACNTASGQGAGSEAISGLGRAFFYAGARALLVSNWPVETTSAKALTTDLFRRQRENPRLTRAQALQQTMTALMDGPGLVDARSGKVVFSYAHPIFWAPFTLVGDGGGGR